MLYWFTLHFAGTFAVFALRVGPHPFTAHYRRFSWTWLCAAGAWEESARSLPARKLHMFLSAQNASLLVQGESLNCFRTRFFFLTVFRYNFRPCCWRNWSMRFISARASIRMNMRAWRWANPPRRLAARTTAIWSRLPATRDKENRQFDKSKLIFDRCLTKWKRKPKLNTQST